jgi:hypothetical protein
MIQSADQPNDGDFPVTPGCHEAATRDQQDAKLAELIKKAFISKKKDSVYVWYKTYEGHLVPNTRAGIIRSKEFSVVLTKLICTFVDDKGKVCGTVISSISGGAQSNSNLRTHSKTHGLDPDNGWVQLARKSTQQMIKISGTGTVIASVRFVDLNL